GASATRATRRTSGWTPSTRASAVGSEPGSRKDLGEGTVTVTSRNAPVKTSERTAPAGVGAPGRARLDIRTLRTDRWWLQPLITFTVLVAFIIYATIRAFMNKYYFKDPYISPFYSPCLSSS